MAHLNKKNKNAGAKQNQKSIQPEYLQADDRLTKDEHQKLQNVFVTLQQFEQERRQIFFEKTAREVELNKWFNDAHETVDLALRNAMEKRDIILRELQSKYGFDKAFEIDTGKIRVNHDQQQ